MSKDKIDFYLSIKTCPVCGKKFHPMPEHQWRTGAENKTGKLVCTYTCMRKWEKENNLKRRGDKS